MILSQHIDDSITMKRLCYFSVSIQVADIVIKTGFMHSVLMWKMQLLWDRLQLITLGFFIVLRNRFYFEKGSIAMIRILFKQLKKSISNFNCFLYLKTINNCVYMK